MQYQCNTFAEFILVALQIAELLVVISGSFNSIPGNESSTYGTFVPSYESSSYPRVGYPRIDRLPGREREKAEGERRHERRDGMPETAGHRRTPQDALVTTAGHKKNHQFLAFGKTFIQCLDVYFSIFKHILNICGMVSKLYV